MILHWLHHATNYLVGSPQRSAKRVSSDIDDELAFHLEQRKHDFIRRGMTAEEAEAAAKERFGNAQRIAAECYSVSMTGTTWFHRVHLVATAALICAVVYFGWSMSRPAVSPELPPGIAAVMQEDWSGDVTGRVVDDNGMPVTGANVLVAVKTWPGGSYFQRPYACLTKADGTFAIQRVHPANQVYEVQVAVVAEGLAMRSQYQSFNAGESRSFKFTLPAAETIQLKLANSAGDSLVGIDVIPVERIDTSGSHELVYFDTAKPIASQTDVSGTIEFSCFQPGDQAVLMVRCDEDEWKRVPVAIPSDQQTFAVRIDL